MSKFNILEFNKNMKVHLKGAVEKAGAEEYSGQAASEGSRQLEAEVLKRLEEKAESHYCSRSGRGN